MRNILNAWGHLGPVPVLPAVAVLLAAVVVVVGGWFAVRGLRRWDAPAGTRGYYLVYLGAMLYSGINSYRVAGKVFDVHGFEQWGILLIVEGGLVAAGLGMRATVDDRSRVAPHRMFLLFLMILAGAGALYVLGPVNGVMQVGIVACGIWALHLALGIEVTSATSAPRPAIGMLTRIWSELRERALSRLGLADDARDALQRTRDRAIRRAAYLAATPTAWRRNKRLIRAIRASNAAHDPAAKDRLLAELAVLQHALALGEVQQPSPWHTSQAQPLLVDQSGRDQVGVVVGKPQNPTTVGRAVPDQHAPVPVHEPDPVHADTEDTLVFSTINDHPVHTPTTVPEHLVARGRDQADHGAPLPDFNEPVTDQPDHAPDHPELEPAHAQVNEWSGMEDGHPDHDRSGSRTAAGTLAQAGPAPAASPTMVGNSMTPSVTSPVSLSSSSGPWSGSTSARAATAADLRDEPDLGPALPDHTGRDGRPIDEQDPAAALRLDVDGKTKDQIADLLSPIAQALAAEDDFLSREDVVTLTGVKSRGTAGQILQMVKERHPGHPDASGRRKPDRTRTIAHAVAQITGRPHLNAVR